MSSGVIEFDNGSRWELGDTTAGGAHEDSRIIEGQMVPGFITLCIVSSDGSRQQYRYNLDKAEPIPRPVHMPQEFLDNMRDIEYGIHRKT